MAVVGDLGGPVVALRRPQLAAADPALGLGIALGQHRRPLHRAVVVALALAALLLVEHVDRAGITAEADIFVCVAQWPWPRVPVFELMSRARAAENQVWTLSCNRAGEASLGGKGEVMRFPGMALCIDPLGEVSARVDDGQLLLADIDLDMATKVRKSVPLARDLERAGLWPSQFLS